MSGLSNLQKRIDYRGGARQVDRMIADKERSLNKALLYSYQSATIELVKTKEQFRCLINPNKFTMEADDKIISIPFEDICLNKPKPEEAITSTGKTKVDLVIGDVIKWKGKTEDKDTYWIVYSQYLQETAYFRGQMRQCENEPIYINNQPYYFYLKGPDEKGIDWLKSKRFIFNDLNYSLEIYISKTKETNEFFQRFKKCKILDKNWEVQAVDRYSTDGILIVYLKEDYSNIWEDAPPSVEEDVIEIQEENPVTFGLRRATAQVIPAIEGPNEVYPYDIVSYKILNATGGEWILSNKRARIKSFDDSSVIIEITTGKSGSISLIYRVQGIEDIILNINILSL